MFTGNESKRIDVVLEFYRQTCLNMRMFVDLRFKHFTTFMVITGLLGAAAFNVPSIAVWRSVIIVVAIIVTVLFWLIDARTSQYWRQEFLRVQSYERALNEGVQLLLPPPERTRLRSATATNLLFVVILASWTGGLVANFFVPSQQAAPKQPPVPVAVTSSPSISSGPVAASALSSAHPMSSSTAPAPAPAPTSSASRP